MIRLPRLKRPLCILTFAVLFATIARPAVASTIFFNGTPDNVNAFGSDIASGFASADDFILGAGANTITDLHWFGAYAFANTAPAADDFTIRLYQNTGGAPDVAPIIAVNIGNATRVATGGAIFGFDVYEYFAFVAPITLSPGVYWLSIVNDTGADDDDWFWATSAQSGNAHQRFEGGAWQNQGAELAFSLTDDASAPAPVPEPATLSLVGVGLAGAAGRRFRKRR
jgi:hypothetical protein